MGEQFICNASHRVPGTPETVAFRRKVDVLAVEAKKNPKNKELKAEHSAMELKAQELEEKYQGRFINFEKGTVYPAEDVLVPRHFSPYEEESPDKDEPEKAEPGGRDKRNSKKGEGGKTT